MTGTPAPTGPAAAATTASPTSDQVWRAICKASFAVVSQVTPEGKPRSSGVMYATVGHRLYVVTDPSSWKARQISDGDEVAVTVPVRRGGLLALMAPIPPATISFHAAATLHQPGSSTVRAMTEQLKAVLPPDRRDAVTVIELAPQGRFLTYGIGVSLMTMRKPEQARSRVPVD